MGESKGGEKNEPHCGEHRCMLADEKTRYVREDIEKTVWLPTAENRPFGGKFGSGGANAEGKPLNFGRICAVCLTRAVQGAIMIFNTIGR